MDTQKCCNAQEYVQFKNPKQWRDDVNNPPSKNLEETTVKSETTVKNNWFAFNFWG